MTMRQPVPYTGPRTDASAMGLYGFACLDGGRSADRRFLRIHRTNVIASFSISISKPEVYVATISRVVCFGQRPLGLVLALTGATARVSFCSAFSPAEAHRALNAATWTRTEVIEATVRPAQDNNQNVFQHSLARQPSQTNDYQRER